MSKATGRIWLLALLIAGFVFVAAGISRGRQIEHFVMHGQAATGMVNGIERPPGGGKGATNSLLVQYEAGGKSFTLKDTIYGIQMAYPGDTLPVLFLPENPARAIVDRGIWNWGSTVFYELIGFGSLIGWFKIRRAERAKLVR